MPKKQRKIKAVRHNAERLNIPTEELGKRAKAGRRQHAAAGNQSAAAPLVRQPTLFWKNKLESTGVSEPSAPIFVQELVQPQAIINSIRNGHEDKSNQDVLFEGWAEKISTAEKLNFYAHRQSWQNRLILGDSLLVMRSLARQEGLNDSVQCIYFDPPYGIKFNSNWQPTTTNVMSDDTAKSMAKEPEPIKVYRDTWAEGLNSYLTYLKDRLAMCGELLNATGSIFVQIGDENVHLIRCLLDEVFGSKNFVSQITYRTRTSLARSKFPSVGSFILWYAKNKEVMKFNELYVDKEFGPGTGYTKTKGSNLLDRKMSEKENSDPPRISESFRPYLTDNLISTGRTSTCLYDYPFQGKTYHKRSKSWKTTKPKMDRLVKADRVVAGKKNIHYRRYFDDFMYKRIDSMWNELRTARDPIYAVQTNEEVVQRCILMTSDPGDLVLDPTCGSGTTAVVAEHWGRRWITMDTSRVAVTLARSRLIGSSYPYFVLNDSAEGNEIKTNTSSAPPPPPGKSEGYNNEVELGFALEHCGRVTIKSITENLEIDRIHDMYQPLLEKMLNELNDQQGADYQAWELLKIEQKEFESWPDKSRMKYVEWKGMMMQRQEEINNSISRNAEQVELVDRPIRNDEIVRVSGPFTVESISPTKSLTSVDAIATNQSEIIDNPDDRPRSEQDHETKFVDKIRLALLNSPIYNSIDEETISFLSVDHYPESDEVTYAATYMDKSETERKGAIYVGPEFGTIDKDQVMNTLDAVGKDFDTVFFMGFAFDPYTSDAIEKSQLTKALKIHLHNDLHMAEQLKLSAGTQLFVIVGEPDIVLQRTGHDALVVEIAGMDVFDPSSGEVKSSDSKDIACWMLDTNYDGEIFIPRHIYFCEGIKDPFAKLKKSLKAEIAKSTWDSIYATKSREFKPPSTGRVAIKAINKYCVETLKVLRIDEM